MYLKILPIIEDKYTNMGIINVEAALYLEKGDEEYDRYMSQHYLYVPVIPQGGYSRRTELEAAHDLWSNTIDLIISSGCILPKDNREAFYKEYSEYVALQNEIILFNEWRNSLPHVWELNPFCYHSIQFDVDDLEITPKEKKQGITIEEKILWCFEFALGITHRNYIIADLACKWEGKIANQPFHYSARKSFYQGVSLIPENLRSNYMKSEMAKVPKAANTLCKLKDVDFSAIKTIGKYSVRK